VVSACIASGTLECGGVVPTKQVRRGEQLYARMCAVCHGAEGQGYVADQAPALAHPRFIASATDEFLRTAITDGRTGTTMSAWSTTHGGPLDPGEIGAVVAFLRDRQDWPRPVLDERAPAGDAARGAELFARECVPCHGREGKGGPNVHIGNLDLLSSASNGFLRYAIRQGRPGTLMPGFESALGEHGVEDVLAALRSWEAHAAVAPKPPPARPPPIPLGPIPLNPHGPEPVGFRAYPQVTSVDVVKGQLDRHARIGVLDARVASDYLLEHIAGSVSVPFYDPSPYLNSLPKDAWLVCYCACPRAESGALADKLVAKGFTKLTVLEEGLWVWKARHYSTRTGVDP
jgi:mono/diheme cytochrome c family protein/rhodanese-related sulfurtransferase